MMVINQKIGFRQGLLRLSLVFAAGLPVSGCAPASYVTLLENTDGSIGKVIVIGNQGSNIIDQANYAAELDGSSEELFAVSQERIKEDFSGALSAQPPLPRRFQLYFETGGAELTAESKQKIPEIIANIGNRPAADISVTGHTDTAGDAKANEELGLKRAKSVAELLVEQNIHVPITIASHGETNLLVPTEDQVAEPLNRMVEISVR